MSDIQIFKSYDKGSNGKCFPIKPGDELSLEHITSNGQDIIRLTVNDVIEFEYDVNDPSKEIVGHFTTLEELKEKLTPEEYDSLII
ncbi:hypothetical protein AAAC51_06730 [Priestia megaterium]